MARYNGDITVGIASDKVDYWDNANSYVTGYAARTLSCWVQISAIPAGTGGNTHGSYFWHMGDANDQIAERLSLRVQTQTESSSGSLRSEVHYSFKYGGTDICDGDWHHIAIVCDGTQTYPGNTKHYVDGVEQTSLTGGTDRSMNTTNTNGYHTTLGAQTGVGSEQPRGWGGSTAEHGHWDRALSDSEIAMLAEGVSPSLIDRGLKFYVPYIRDKYELANSYSLDTDGSNTVITHPRVWYSRSNLIGIQGAGDESSSSESSSSESSSSPSSPSSQSSESSSSPSSPSSQSSESSSSPSSPSSPSSQSSESSSSESSSSISSSESSQSLQSSLSSSQSSSSESSSSKSSESSSSPSSPSSESSQSSESSSSPSSPSSESSQSSESSSSESSESSSSPSTIPTPLSPSNGANVTRPNVSLTWTDESVDGYDVEIYRDSGLSVLETSAEDVVDNSFNTTYELDNNHTYYWRVRSVEGGSPGEWSTTFNFTTDSSPLSLTKHSPAGTAVLSASDVSASSIYWFRVYESDSFPEVTTSKKYFALWSTDHDSGVGGIWWGDFDDLDLNDFNEQGKIWDANDSGGDYDQTETPHLVRNPDDSNGRYLYLYYHEEDTGTTYSGVVAQCTKLISSSGGALHSASWTDEGVVMPHSSTYPHTGYQHVVRRGTNNWHAWGLSKGGSSPEFHHRTSTDGKSWTVDTLIDQTSRLPEDPHDKLQLSTITNIELSDGNNYIVTAMVNDGSFGGSSTRSRVALMRFDNDTTTVAPHYVLINTWLDPDGDESDNGRSVTAFDDGSETLHVYYQTDNNVFYATGDVPDISSSSVSSSSPSSQSSESSSSESSSSPSSPSSQSSESSSSPSSPSSQSSESSSSPSSQSSESSSSPSSLSSQSSQSLLSSESSSSESSLSSGDLLGSITWGHHTLVAETFDRDFSGNWTGTGTISGTGDAEKIIIYSGEYMESETRNVGNYEVEILKNTYSSGSGPTFVIEYKDGNTKSSCEASSWTTYVSPFVSLGWVKVKISR